MFGLGRKSSIESNKMNAVRDLLLEERKFTSDAFWLQQRANWLVFLYCDMQKGHPAPANQCDLVWWGYSKNPYTVWKNDLGTFSHPVAFSPDERLKAVYHNRVKGQVVRMRTDRLIQLDVQRQNGVQFLRKRIPISIPSTVINPSYNDDRRLIPCENTVWAWAYVGNPDFWINQVPKISKINVRTKEGEKTTEFLMKIGSKVIQPIQRYKPNNNSEPYYYFPPNR